MSIWAFCAACAAARNDAAALSRALDAANRAAFARLNAEMYADMQLARAGA